MFFFYSFSHKNDTVHNVPILDGLLNVVLYKNVIYYCRHLINFLQRMCLKIHKNRVFILIISFLGALEKIGARRAYCL